MHLTTLPGLDVARLYQNRVVHVSKNMEVFHGSRYI